MELISRGKGNQWIRQKRLSRKRKIRVYSKNISQVLWQFHPAPLLFWIFDLSLLFPLFSGKKNLRNSTNFEAKSQTILLPKEKKNKEKNKRNYHHPFHLSSTTSKTTEITAPWPPSLSLTTMTTTYYQPTRGNKWCMDKWSIDLEFLFNNKMTFSLIRKQGRKMAHSTSRIIVMRKKERLKRRCIASCRLVSLFFFFTVISSFYLICEHESQSDG